MAGLINIGLTGLQASQTALNTTGNNVSNANTQGYSRQEVDFSPSPTLPSGAGYLGSGVSIDAIRRLNSEFANSQLRSDTTLYNEQDTLSTNLKQVDNLLGDKTTGLNSALSDFFGALQTFNDPSSIPQRQQVLGQADSLVSRFHSIYSTLSSLQQGIDQQMSTNVSQINTLASEIAKLNVSIASAQGAAQGQQPNDLLDQRDEKLRKLSELVQVKVIKQNNNSVNVMIGNGQGLVVGNQATSLKVINSPQNASRQEVAMVGANGPQIISRELTGGKLGAILQFRDQTLTPAFNQVGRVAIALANQVNKQHQLGMDLQGRLGGLFFNDINNSTTAAERVIPNADNAKPDDRVLSVDITDPSALSADDYQLQFDGANNQDYSIKDVNTGQIVKQGSLTGVLPTKIQMPGFTVTLTSGSFQQGDSFLLRPTHNGAADIGKQVSSVDQLALASPIRGTADLGNQGDATIDQGTMLNVVNPLTNQPLKEFSTPGKLSPPLEVHFTSATTYEVLDVSDPANPKPLQPPMNNLTFQPGVTNTLFTADPGQTEVSMAGTALNQVGPVVASGAPDNNGYLGQTVTISARDPNTGQVTQQSLAIPAGQSAQATAAQLGTVNGVSATAYTEVKLSNFVDNGDASVPSLTINGQTLNFTPPATFSADGFVDAVNNNSALQSQGITAVSDGNSLTLKSTTGADITVGVGGGGDSVDVQKLNPYGGASPAATAVGSGNKETIGGYVDVTMKNGVSLSANNDNLFKQTPIAKSTYLGFQFHMSGIPQTGDSFQISFNTDGTSDNRNAVALGNISNLNLLGNGKSSLSDGYSQLVESVGTRTSQATLDQSSSKTLLNQSKNQWQQISGVNLDQEAGKMIQFQAAYNASAQVVRTARELFNTLLGAFQ